MLILFLLTILSTPHWTVQNSGVTVRLRGVSAVSERVAWASGAGSTASPPPATSSASSV